MTASKKTAFTYSGFADEAGDSIQEQIRATKELGWKRIESRKHKRKKPLRTSTMTVFEETAAALADSGVTIDCFGSAVANWAKDPRSEEDFQKSVEEAGTGH